MFHEHGNLLFVQNAAVVLVNTLEPLPGDADVRGAVVDALRQALEAGELFLLALLRGVRAVQALERSRHPPQGRRLGAVRSGASCTISRRKGQVVIGDASWRAGQHGEAAPGASQARPTGPCGAGQLLTRPRPSGWAACGGYATRCTVRQLRPQQLLLQLQPTAAANEREEFLTISNIPLRRAKELFQPS